MITVADGVVLVGTSDADVGPYCRCLSRWGWMAGGGRGRPGPRGRGAVSRTHSMGAGADLWLGCSHQRPIDHCPCLITLSALHPENFQPSVSKVTSYDVPNHQTLQQSWTNWMLETGPVSGRSARIRHTHLLWLFGMWHESWKKL